MWRTWRRRPDRTLLLFFVCFALTVAPRADADELPQPLVAALKLVGIPDTHIGLVIQDMDANVPMLAHGEGRSFNPASVMKLLTTLAALDSLGPAHTWQTQILADGEIRDGELDGNLIIRGGGDPGLTLERFWLLLRKIQAKGVRHIKGDVVLDSGYYQIDTVDPGAFDQEPLQPYNAQPSALLVNYNALNLRLKPTAAGLEGQLEPPALKLSVSARLLDGKYCGGWEDGLHYALQGETLRVQGQYQDGCGERQTWLNLLPAEENTAAVFVYLWRELGGSLDGRVRPGEAPAEAAPLLTFDSQPLGRLVLDVNEYSNNVMAKMLFLNLGAQRFGAPATWCKGEAAVRTWLRENGLVFPELVLENGSGLSRIERISTASMAKLLKFASTRPVFHEFAASLPSLGREGTLKSRLADGPFAGRAWLKTGTLNGARNLAGYFLDSLGRWKLLALFINHPRAGKAAIAQDALVTWAMTQRATASP